jgi:hypothetical protein
MREIVEEAYSALTSPCDHRYGGCLPLFDQPVWFYEKKREIFYRELQYAVGAMSGLNEDYKTYLENHLECSLLTYYDDLPTLVKKVKLHTHRYALATDRESFDGDLVQGRIVSAFCELYRARLKFQE